MSVFRRSLRRELTHLQQDKGDHVLTFWLLPALCLFVWWIFSAGQPEQLPIAVLDQDRSPLSRQLIRLVDAAPGVAVTLSADDSSIAVDALRKRKVYGLLILPKDLQNTVYQGQSAELVLQLNSQYTTYASTLQRGIQQAIGTAGAAISAERLQRLGVFTDASVATVMPVQVLATPLYNEGPNYEVFLAATLIPALFQILAMVLTVSAIGRELRDGTAQDWLDTANGSVVLALCSKLLPYWSILCLYGAGYVWFFQQLVPHSYTGSPLGIWLSFVLMNAAAMAVGVLLVALTRNFRMALSLAGFYSAPAFAYSGQAFPLVAMPELAQYWASILPLTHWLKIYNQQWLAAAPVMAVKTPWLILLSMLVFASIAGLVLLKRSGFKPENWGAR
ncbi:ABC transporter permease [Alkalimonas sp. MEB108]|uniref:ABC transporter permease n=1 Tax=Alkalimonas cellulosilytica TaxID=3058395 RepID=A0ABU7J5U2_9GAMM|nr:ABC transporter permease [Alkalimonas sp. MEB108]MEE2001372.1 ABC transporter permease [Alkalimonas sp. MEB108]